MSFKRHLYLWILRTPLGPRFLAWRESGRALDRYDSLTARLIQNLPPDAVCWDIGAHVGEITARVLEACPAAEVHACEPVPFLARFLRRRFRADPRVHVHEVAIGERSGSSEFYLDLDAPGLSGLRSRDLPDRMKRLNVRIQTLTELHPKERKLDFIKIDVEGAELGVLEGAGDLLKRWRPLIVFEHGRGGAEHFATTPEAVYDKLTEQGLAVSRLDSYLAQRTPLTRAEFGDCFRDRTDYYFVAHRSQKDS